MRLKEFFLSLLLGAIMTFVFGKLAIRLDFLDEPNNINKHQERPVAYMGGLALFWTVILSLIMLKVQLDNRLKSLLGLSLLVMLLGLLDDCLTIRYDLKLGAQTIIAIISIRLGARVDLFSLNKLNYIFSFLWIIGLMNAYNIIDGMDGLAAGIGIIVSLGFAYFSYKKSISHISQIMVLLAGGQAGFLFFNWPPAKIYLGDAGSLFIGYVFAIVSIFCFWKEGFTYDFPIPIYLSYLPIFDTIFVFIKRIKDGRSPFKTSEDHYPRRLKKMGYSVKQIDAFSYLLTLIFFLLSYLVIEYQLFIIDFLICIVITYIFINKLFKNIFVKREKVGVKNV